MPGLLDETSSHVVGCNSMNLREGGRGVHRTQGQAEWPRGESVSENCVPGLHYGAGQATLGHGGGVAQGTQCGLGAWPTTGMSLGRSIVCQDRGLTGVLGQLQAWKSKTSSFPQGGR